MVKKKADEFDHSALSDMLARNFELISSANDKIMDMWMINLGSMKWLNDQWEAMVHSYLNQRKAMREELVNVAEQMVTQIQKNMAQIEELVREGVMASVENFNYNQFSPMKSYMDLVKQVDELTRKVENKQ